MAPWGGKPLFWEFLVLYEFLLCPLAIVLPVNWLCCSMNCFCNLHPIPIAIASSRLFSPNSIRVSSDLIGIKCRSAQFRKSVFVGIRSLLEFMSDDHTSGYHPVRSLTLINGFVWYRISGELYSLYPVMHVELCLSLFMLYTSLPSHYITVTQFQYILMLTYIYLNVDECWLISSMP